MRSCANGDSQRVRGSEECLGLILDNGGLDTSRHARTAALGVSHNVCIRMRNEAQNGHLPCSTPTASVTRRRTLQYVGWTKMLLSLGHASLNSRSRAPGLRGRRYMEWDAYLEQLILCTSCKQFKVSCSNPLTQCWRRGEPAFLSVGLRPAQRQTPRMASTLCIFHARMRTVSCT